MSIDPTASRLAASGVAFAPEIANAARRNRVDPDLLAAVAAQETGGPDTNAGHNVVGDGGHGHGLFQIDDRSHSFAETPAAMSPSANADYAAGMLSRLLKRYGGNLHEALSAYNSGSPDGVGTRTRWADGSNLGYADSVMRHYERLTGALAGSSPGNTCAESGDPAHSSVVAEPDVLVASLGTLSTQAQRLPLSAVSLPAVPHDRPYHRQATDYAQLFDDSGETDSQ
jgi:Transglycosylase SLT domain